MFTLRINNELSTPIIFQLVRRLDNLEVEISPEIDGFELIAPDESTQTGTTRRELMHTIREIVR